MKLTSGDQGRTSGCGEAMSRLIDGELDGAGCRELVERLKTDADARRGWVLMNIACDAVRSNETAALHSDGFVTRFSAVLAAEPVVLAPRRPVLERQRMLRRVVLPTAAVAAAAAVLVVVALPLRGTQAPPEVALAPKDEIKQVSAPVAAPADDDVIRSNVFEAYLDAHRESGAGPVTWRANEYVTNAALKAESR